MKNDDFGVLYIASGQKHFREAVASYSSLVSVDKNIPAVFVTDPTNQNDEIFNRKECQAVIRKDMTFSYFDKAFFVDQSPFKKTLLLDSDTIVLATIKGLKDILDVFDLALCLDTSRGKIYYPPPYYDKTPKPYRFLHQYNDGVMLFRKNKKTQLLLKIWKDLCKKEYNISYLAGGKFRQRSMTQPSLMLALGRSDIKLVTLPYEFNYRLTWGAPDAVGPVRIVHGRVGVDQMSSINNNFDKNEFKKPFRSIPNPNQLRIYLTKYNYVLWPNDLQSVERFAWMVVKKKILSMLNKDWT